MDEIETKGIESMNKQEDEIEKAKNIKEIPKVASETLIQIIEEVTKIEIESIKGNSKSKRRSDIRRLYINMLKKYTDLSGKEILDLLGVGKSTVTNILSGRYKVNDFIINLSIEIEKYVNL
jgi:chromosomal replication initiation ATPase DnaA